MSGTRVRIVTTRFAWAVVAAAMGALVLGCGGQAPSRTSGTESGKPAAAGAKTSIAGILFQEDQFFRMCELGMRAAAEQYNVDLTVDNSQNSLDKEISLVDTYAGQGKKAIVIAPLNVKASIPALKRANDQGIAIVTYDGYIDADFPKSNIKSDQVSLGRTTGEVVRKYIETKLGGKAKVAIIQYLALSPILGGMRVQGFKEAIAGMPGVEVVAAQDAWLAEPAANVVQSILTANPDLNIIWAANEGGTVGAVTGVKSAGKAGQVVVFGTDMSEQIGDFLLASDNILQAVTGQKPYDIGFTALQSAVKALKGEPVEAKVSLPGRLFSRDDPAGIKEYQQFIKKLSQ